MSYLQLLLAVAALAACGDDATAVPDASTDTAPAPDAADTAEADLVEPDAGPPPMSTLFGECVNDDQCPGASFCRTASEGYAGGECSAVCTLGDRGPCELDGFYHHCLQRQGAAQALCERRCLNGGDCPRENYGCASGALPDGSGYCQSVCSADDDCGSGAECNVYSGLCVAEGALPSRGVTGDPCTAAATSCNGDVCIAPRNGTTPTGWNGGYCAGRCILPAGYNTNTFFAGDALPAGTCPGDNVCFPNGSLTRGDIGICLDGCSSDADCRVAEGYGCIKDFPLTSGDVSHYTNGACMPISCQTLTCPVGFTCATIRTTAGNRFVCTES